MKFIIKYMILVIAVLIWTPPLTVRATSPVNVLVSILPQKYFVEKIGRQNVRVDVLVKPGKSPSTYSPSPDQMKKLAAADIYFRIGVPFENGLLKKIASIADAKIVDTRRGILMREMDGHGHGEDRHDHGIAGQADTDFIGKDPHIWMDPLLVKTQALTIFQTLCTIDPANRDTYKINYDQFAGELDTLDIHLRTALKALKGENLFVFHPTFGYFTDAYGLKQVAIETMGKAPKGKDLSALIKLAKKEKTRVIFVQPQFDRNTAEKIASAINGVVVSIDPLAYEYLANMEKMAQDITRALNK